MTIPAISPRSTEGARAQERRLVTLTEQKTKRTALAILAGMFLMIAAGFLVASLVTRLKPYISAPAALFAATLSSVCFQQSRNVNHQLKNLELQEQAFQKSLNLYYRCYEALKRQGSPHAENFKPLILHLV